MIEMILGLVERFLDILLTVTVLKPVATFLSLMWSNLSFWELKLIKPKMLYVMQNLSRALYQPDAAWSGFVADFLNRLTGGLVKAEDIQKQSLGIGSSAAMESLGNAFLRPLLALVMPSPAEVQGDPLKACNRFLGLNLQFNMSSWLLHVIADTYSMGRVKGLITLPSAISRSFGFGRLSRFALGPAFKFTVVDPMTALFNKIYTPEGYTREQIASLLRHGLISATDYINRCLELGIAPSKAALLYEVGEKELADAWLKRLTDMGWIKSAEVQKELTRRGYSPERAEILARLIIDDRKLDLVNKVIDAAANLYKDGVLDRTKLEGYLSKANYNADEITLFIAQLDLEKSRRRFLTQAQVVQLWINKKLGRVECKNYLVNLLSMTPEDAELYMTLKEGV